MAHSLDGVRFVVGFALLAYASLRDLKVRRVENEVWVWGAAIGLLLFGLDGFVMGRANWIHLAVAAVVIGLAYVLWYFHILAGGADAKALMMLAVLLPVPIELDVAGRAFPVWASPMPVALVVLANSVLLFLLVPFAFAAGNLLRGHVRLPAMFLGVRMPIDRAAASFVWVVERAQPDGSIRQNLWASRFTAEDHRANLDRLSELGRTHVWTTPKIPFMVPLWSGFVLAFLAGDLLTHWLVVPALEWLR